MKRRLFVPVAALLFALVLIPAASVYADEIAVTINGQPVVFGDQNPEIVDGRTLVPVAGVFQALGFEVEWNHSERQAVITRGADTVLITIGSNTFTRNGVGSLLDVPAQIIGGRTMLPIGAILQNLGYNVDWDSASRTVVITERVVAAPPAPEPIVPDEPEVPEQVTADEDEIEIAEEPAESPSASVLLPDVIIVDGEEFPYATVVFEGVEILPSPSPDFIVASNIFLTFLSFLTEVDFDEYLDWDSSTNRVIFDTDLAGLELTEREAAEAEESVFINVILNGNDLFVTDSYLRWFTDPFWNNFVVDYETLIYIAELQNATIVWDESGLTLTITEAIEGVDDPVPLRDILDMLYDEYDITNRIVFTERNQRATLNRGGLSAVIDLRAETVTSGTQTRTINFTITGGTTFINEQELLTALREIGFLE